MNFIDLQRQYQNYKKEIDTQIQEVLDRACFIMGDKVADLEGKLADFIGTKHAVSCGSGTDALLLALVAYDVKPGDEIITTPFSFISTAEVIAFLGARPVFVDIDQETYNIDPAKIKKAITDKTRGIIAVDIFGQCADYEEIEQIAGTHHLFVIEDAAQSFGAEYKGKKAGSFGNVGCTSFFPAKPFGCYGDGGMIFTDEEKLTEVMKSVRVHGQGKNKYDHIRVGFNSRLDTLQAAILLAKFKYFPKEIEKRQKCAHYYTDRLKEYVPVPKVLDHNLSTFCQYCIRVKDRNDLQKKLRTLDIPTAVHYPIPLHMQKAFSYLGYQKGDFAVAEELCEDILALPMHPFLLKEEQDAIIDVIIDL